MSPHFYRRQCLIRSLGARVLPVMTLALAAAAAPPASAQQRLNFEEVTAGSVAPIVMDGVAMSPATSAPGCTPTTSLLRFDGGYEVSMCYRTPDGVTGQAKSGLYASAESGLLWFFSRDNAEVLVKVLNGCAINGYRWVFVAPVTTLEFDLRVTSPTGVRWSHGNTQGETAATKSDTAAFACADEPDTAQELMAPRSLATLPAFVAGPQIETTSDSDTPVFVPVTSPNDSGCTPTTSLLRFDGGYGVSMCYRTPDGVAGQANAGLYASEESGLLWFFSRDNAEVLVKVLNGCAINGHRWVFVAPVTTLEFDLWVTSPTGERWTHSNTQGETAATKSDTAAFACADEPDDEPEMAPDLIVSDVILSDANLVVGQSFSLRATVRNVGDARAPATTIRFYNSDNSTISASDAFIHSEAVPALSVSATESMTLPLRALSPGTFYLGACIDPVSGEFRTGNNCSDGVRVVVGDPNAVPNLIVSSLFVSDERPASTGQTIELRATVRNVGDASAPATTIHFKRGAVEIGRQAVPALSAAATAPMTHRVRIRSTDSSLLLDFIACLHDGSPHSAEAECSEAVQVEVQDSYDDVAGVPDLSCPVSPGATSSTSWFPARTLSFM